MKRHTHDKDRRIADLLEHCNCVLFKKTPIGTITVYSTKSGLVAFLDHDNKGGGWTLLSECPSGLISENVDELKAMIEGTDDVRNPSNETAERLDAAAGVLP